MVGANLNDWLKRPPRLLCAVAIVWFAIVIIMFSDVGVPFSQWLLISFSSIGLAAGLVIRFFSTYIHGSHDQNGWIRQHWRWWIVASATVVLGFVLSATLPLLSLRVYLSARALRESPPVLSALSQADLYSQGRWVGLFHVTEFSQFGRELRFITNECGLVDNCGIVFSPDGPPPSRGEDSFSHLFGPWWHWYQSW